MLATPKEQSARKVSWRRVICCPAGVEQSEEQNSQSRSQQESVPEADKTQREEVPSSEENKDERRTNVTNRLQERWKKTYRLEKGMLFKIDMAPGNVQPMMRLVVPERWRRTIVWDLHNQICHLSVHRTYKIVSKQFYWENMLSSIKKFVTECPRCQRTRVGPRRLAPPLLSLRKQGPWDTVGIDIYGPLPRTRQ